MWSEFERVKNNNVASDAWNHLIMFRIVLAKFCSQVKIKKQVLQKL